MATLFRNPNLDDYFVEVAGVTSRTPPGAIRPVTEPYEDGKVLTFPDLRFDIDHDFWAGLPADGFPKLKKLSSSAAPGDFDDDRRLDRSLQEAALPPAMEADLRREIRRIYEQVLPVYEALFGDYVFTRRQVVWRLNTIRNENLHVDTYRELFPDHFARLFINLDNQPRIWQTSYSIQEIAARFAKEASPEILREGDGSAIFLELNRAAFGAGTREWWDGRPRHVAYFDPGDVWAVDSRQRAHQIFYGRRAVSIDFFVDPKSMKHPERQYLALAERFRALAD
jgi:hypothetical protein